MYGLPAIPVPPWTTYTAAEYAQKANLIHGQVGQAFVDDDNCVWVLLKAGAAISRGNSLMSSMAVDSITNIDTVSAIDSTLITDTGSTFVTNGVTADMMISISDATGEGQIGVIEEVVSETVLRVTWITSDDGKLTTATDTTSDAVIFAPWLAALSLASGTRKVNCIGIAQEDVTSGYYFFALRDGIGSVLADTSVAIVANQPVVSGDTAGQVTGYAGNELALPCGTAVHDQDADGKIIPVIAHCQPISRVPRGRRIA